MSGTDISRITSTCDHVDSSRQQQSTKQESRKVSRRQNQPVAYSVENDEVEQGLDDTSFYDSSGRDNNAITPPEAKSDVFKDNSYGALSRCYARCCLCETEAMLDAFRWLLTIGDDCVGVGVSIKV